MPLARTGFVNLAEVPAATLPVATVVQIEPVGRRRLAGHGNLARLHVLLGPEAMSRDETRQAAW